jgi:hypothetical protein
MKVQVLEEKFRVLAVERAVKEKELLLLEKEETEDNLIF